VQSDWPNEMLKVLCQSEGDVVGILLALAFLTCNFLGEVSFLNLVHSLGGEACLGHQCCLEQVTLVGATLSEVDAASLLAEGHFV